jgi:hypothetical protein
MDSVEAKTRSADMVEEDVLVDVHANILSVFHLGAPFRRSEPTPQAYEKGAPFL